MKAKQQRLRQVNVISLHCQLANLKDSAKWKYVFAVVMWSLNDDDAVRHKDGKGNDVVRTCYDVEN